MSEQNNATTATDTTAATSTAATTAAPDATTTATSQPGSTPDTTAATDTATPEVLLGGQQPAEQPIQYTDFKMPEGFELNGDDSKVLQELGQQFKMPQEAVQKLVDLGVQMQQRQAAQQQQTIRSWVDAAKADAEYGGDKLQQSLLTAQKAFTLPRGGNIAKILLNSGLGNHPDVIGFMTEVGKLLESDNMVTGKGSNSAPSLGQLWYGDKQ
ncbi:hypothetical protein F900_01827 [Acinetobacter modestus]|uniref:Uncharacterized protein n=1 Tax=Acinetobacter modestus TaxID=1776740 RepID=N9NHI7_9GAMM|nr:hypothetical protein [Acinetobacter modestus]ENX01460.1 hypothetical protein F900_01827 [Acinetobacter modestus]